MDDQVKKELSRCVRCGACMKVCPVFEVSRHEGYVARGKLMLVESWQNDALDASKRYRQLLSACLLCGRCKSSCPNEVDTPLIVQAARAEMAQQGKAGWFKRLILRRVLPSRRLLPRLLKGARFSRALWAAKVPGDSGLHLRYLRDSARQRRYLPPLAPTFFLEGDLPKEFAGSKTQVALFVGCVSNFIRPQAAQSALEVLTRAGASVAVPRGQGCCGLPAYGAGENQAARELARRNLDAVLPEGKTWPDVITTPCASCAWMLAKQMPQLLASDPLLFQKAQQFAARVVPFSRLWANLGKVEQEGPGRQLRDGPVIMTYHDPCHLSRGLGEKDAPRFLLTQLPGVSFVEMEHPCRCCGHGGSFNVAHYDLSMDIAKLKADRVLATGANVLVTECSGCVLQLIEAMKRAKAKVTVLTTAEAANLYGKK